VKSLHLMIILAVWAGCTAHRDGLRQGTTDTWSAESRGFELTIPSTARFTGSSVQPYTLSIHDGKTGIRAALEILDAGKDCTAILEERIGAIKGASILGRGQMMMWGRAGVIARVTAPAGRILLTVINLRQQICVLTLEQAANGLDDDAALDAAQGFLDALLNGMRFP